MDGWLVVLGLTALLGNISVLYRAVTQREGEREERIDESKNVQPPPHAPTASAIGPCPTVIKWILVRNSLKSWHEPSYLLKASVSERFISVNSSKLCDSMLIYFTTVNNWDWSGGAMALGKLPVPGRPAILIIVGLGPIALAVGAGGGLFGHFYSSLSFLSSFSPLWETARYRLKYCLGGPLNPKQPTELIIVCSISLCCFRAY